MDATLVGGPYMRAQRSGAKAKGPRLSADGPATGSLAEAMDPGGSAMGPVPGRVPDHESRTEGWGKLGRRDGWPQAGRRADKRPMVRR